MTRACRQCFQPVGNRVPSAYLCIKCALANTRSKKWTLAKLKEKHEDWWIDSGWRCKTHGSLICQEAACFLDWLGEQ